MGSNNKPEKTHAYAKGTGGVSDYNTGLQYAMGSTNPNGVLGAKRVTDKVLDNEVHTYAPKTVQPSTVRPQTTTNYTPPKNVWEADDWVMKDIQPPKVKPTVQPKVYDPSGTKPLGYYNLGEDEKQKLRAEENVLAWQQHNPNATEEDYNAKKNSFDEQISFAADDYLNSYGGRDDEEAKQAFEAYGKQVDGLVAQRDAFNRALMGVGTSAVSKRGNGIRVTEFGEEDTSGFVDGISVKVSDSYNYGRDYAMENWKIDLNTPNESRPDDYAAYNRTNEDLCEDTIVSVAPPFDPDVEEDDRGIQININGLEFASLKKRLGSLGAAEFLAEYVESKYGQNVSDDRTVNGFIAEVYIHDYLNTMIPDDFDYSTVEDTQFAEALEAWKTTARELNIVYHQDANRQFGEALSGLLGNQAGGIIDEGILNTAARLWMANDYRERYGVWEAITLVKKIELIERYGLEKANALF